MCFRHLAWSEAYHSSFDLAKVELREEKADRALSERGQREAEKKSREVMGEKVE